MRATNFEFRHRFWIISGLFFLAFTSYSFDHRNAVVAGLRWLGHLAGRNLSTPTGYRVLFAVAALVVFAAAMLRTWAAAYLRSEIVHDSNLHSDRLVADGPYRHLRNPLYLGTILLAVGFGAAASLTGFAILAAGMTFFVLRLILREEAELAATQSGSYREYRARVPRLLPSLKPRVPASDSRPQWAQAFRGEAMMWLFGVSMALFAITLKGTLFQAVIVAALVVGFLVSYSTRRKPKAASAADAR